MVIYFKVAFQYITPQMEGQGFPSKVYTIMACAKTFFVMSGKITPIHNLLDLINCALLGDTSCFDSKCQAIVEFLIKASDKT